MEDSAAPIRNREGEIIGVVLVFHDVSDSRKLAIQLSHQASHDPLTGLYNRREFEQRLELAYRVSQITPKAALTAWSRRSGKSAGKNPLAWIAGVVGLLLMLRRRRHRVSRRGR